MDSLKRARLIAAIALLAPTLITASERRVTGLTVEAVAVPANAPIVLDGKLSEEIWQQAPVISEFQQREPAEGQPPTFKTEARVAYDDAAIYIGVRAFDSDASKLVGILTRRDQRSPSDWNPCTLSPVHVDVLNGRADNYADRYRAYAYSRNPDFNYRSFRTTNVLRWEYKPGSSLFVVFQQGKSDGRDFGDFQFRRDLGGVFSAPSHNVFLVKFSYWLNL